MAGVFDIELHDGDAANQDESDDDVIDNREVVCMCLIRCKLYSTATYFNSISSSFLGGIQSCCNCKRYIRVSISLFNSVSFMLSIVIKEQNYWPTF